MSKLIIKDNKVVLSSTGNALISNSPGTDTSDATATAEDILEGKTAYARGEKITGGLVNISSRINYTNAQINTSPNKLLTKNNNLVLDRQGNLLISTSAGIDTSDATATAADIRKGKTAYARGEKLVGTWEKVVKTILSVNSPNPNIGSNNDTWIWQAEV